MKLIERQKCPITDFTSDAELLYEFKDFPINMLARGDTEPEDDLKADMKIGINPDSGVIQIVELPQNDEIYIDKHANVPGKVWREHHERVAKLLRKYAPKAVLEVGGGTGVLESIYNAVTPSTESWIIIEPQPNPVSGSHAEFITGFFPDDLPDDLTFDMFVHTHVLEHMHSPKMFMRKAAEILPVGTRMVFSVPNLKQNLQQKMTSVINFEHTILLTDDYIDLLLTQHGFEVEEKTLFRNHSIIYSTVQTGQRKNETDREIFKRLYRENKRVFLDYVQAHEERVERLNKLIVAETKPIYLFGGHITTQFYMAFGLETDKIKCILDNDIFKHGKRVAGTSLCIEPPAILRESNEAVVILPQSPYADEIKQGIINQLGNRVEFWE